MRDRLEGVVVESRRPSAWWYALPLALLAFAGCIGSVALPLGSVAGQRVADPVAGPGESVHFVMKPNAVYTVYQTTTTRAAGSDCRLAPDGDEAEGLAVTAGGAWRRLFERRPARVVHDGVRYDFGMQLSNSNERGIEVSCRGGPILVESRVELRWSAITLASAVGVLTAAAIAVVAWLRRRRLRRD